MAKKTVWDINFAEKAKIRNRVSEFFTKKVEAIREERDELERKWLEFFYMWNVQKDGNSLYNGRANLYIPEVRKNVESQARALTEAAFPNDDFLTCVPGKIGTNEGAEIQLNVRKHQIKQAQLRMKYHVFARQEALYGTSPVFVPWRKEARKLWMSAKSEKGIKPKRTEIEIYNGPDFVVQDIFRWYALNSKNPDFQEDGCFYIDLIDRFELLAREKSGNLWGRHELERAGGEHLRAKNELEKYVERVEASGLLLENQGYVGEASFRRKENDPSSKMMVTRIYTNIELPEACLPDEDPDVPIPVVIDIYDGKHVGCIKRNGFFHQKAPYVVGKYIQPNPGEFYAQGIPWAIQYMQHEINSKAEQAMDSATLALNPLAFIDPAFAGNQTDYMVEPGGVWFVNPQGVKLAALPDVSQVGYAAISQLSGQMAVYSDRTPALPPQLMGKSRTATQSEIVNTAVNVDLKSFQMNNELAVLEPLMEMWESLTDQNIEDKQILLLSGSDFQKARRVLVHKNKMLGKYVYEWRASSITQNRAILANQLINFMKVYATLPPEDKARAGVRLDEMIKILYREGFALPHMDRVFGLPSSQSTDPATEHEMLLEGIEISVSPGDDDQSHQKAHDEFMADPKLSEEQKAVLVAHIARHQAALEMKARAAQMALMQRQMLMQNQQREGNSVGSGNRTQLNPGSSVGDQASGIRP